MNTIKSLFISAYITYLSAVSAWAVYRIWLNADPGSFGLLLASLPGLGFFIYLFISSTARTGKSLLPLQVPILAGAMLSLWAGDTLMTLAAFCSAAGFLIYVYWYSRLGRQKSTLLEPGTQLPELIFETPLGKKVSLASFTGQPVLMLFYRGNWCPLCMAQIREIAQGYRTLSERGARLLMVSSQPHEQTSSLAEKFDAPLEFLVDNDNLVAEKLGIIHNDGLPQGLQIMGYESDTTMPTVVLCDGKGQVIAADQTDNYRVRPEPDVFLNWLNQAEK